MKTEIDFHLQMARHETLVPATALEGVRDDSLAQIGAGAPGARSPELSALRQGCRIAVLQAFLRSY
jgi:hypothetical protein